MIVYATDHSLKGVAASKQIISQIKGFNSILCKEVTVMGKDEYKYVNNLLPINPYIKIEGNNKFKRLFSLIRIFKKSLSIDKIYTRDLIVVIASVLTKKNVIYEIHKKPRSINRLFFRFFRNYFKICAISDGIKKYCSDNLKFNNKNIITLHDAVNFKEYEQIAQEREELRSDLGMGVDNIYTLYSGTVDFGRDMYRVIELSENFKDVIFYIAGDNGNKFKNVLNIESIPRNIIFLGYIDKNEIIKYQIASDILLNLIDESHPNISFCSQLKLFEYFATGNLIISPNIGSLSEVVNKNNCFIYKTNFSKNASNITEVFKECITFLCRKYPRMPSNIDYARENTWQSRAEKLLNFH